MTAITITPGEHFHNKYGRYSHDEMIGMKFGSKVGFLARMILTVDALLTTSRWIHIPSSTHT
jgi:tRNA A58 N-methylase Trm61